MLLDVYTDKLATDFGGICFWSGVAYAPCVLVLLILAWISYRSGVRRSRLQGNRCLCCGYPLAGLPEPRCPECGMAPPADKGQSADG
jgi:hypothetical protein